MPEVVHFGNSLLAAVTPLVKVNGGAKPVEFVREARLVHVGERRSPRGDSQRVECERASLGDVLRGKETVQCVHPLAIEHEFAVVPARSRMTFVRGVLPTARSKFAPRIAPTQSNAVRRYGEGCDGLRRASVGFGIPGVISPVTGMVKNANTIALNGHPFDKDIAALLGREVRVENDANCFALSEAIDGAGTGAQVVFGVILGTGVGGGIVIDGKVLAGANAIAGEWGHNYLPPDPLPEEGGDDGSPLRGSVVWLRHA